MKSESLTLRISPELKENIELQVQKNKVKTSDFVRAVLERELLNQTEEENIFSNGFSYLTGCDFFNSNEFLYLYTWIVTKMDNRDSNISKDEIYTIKEILFSTINNAVITIDAKREFEKILQDVFHFQNESEYRRHLKFNSNGNSFTLNLSIINDFLSNHFRNRFITTVYLNI